MDGMFFKIMTLTGFAESTKQHKASIYLISIGTEPPVPLPRTLSDGGQL